MWGWLKGIGKIGKAVLPFLPIPGAGAISKGIDFATKAGGVIDAVGGAAAGGAQGMAKNRGANAELEMQRQQLQLGAERERNQTAGDSWKRLMQMAYIGAPASQRVQSPGFSRYSRPISGPTLAQQEMANNPMYRQPLQDRASFKYQPLDFSRLEQQQKMGGWEKLLGIVGAAAPIAGAIGGAQGDKPVIPSRRVNIPGMYGSYSR